MLFRSEEAEAQAEAAEAQAEAEGLTLQRSENQTGYVGVYVNTSNKVKPFEARVMRGGKEVNLGSFATAEEAALQYARTPEAQAQVAQAAPLTAARGGALPSVTMKVFAWKTRGEPAPVELARRALASPIAPRSHS